MPSERVNDNISINVDFSWYTRIVTNITVIYERVVRELKSKQILGIRNPVYGII